MGKFLGGLILGVVAVGAVFVAVPPKAIDVAKQWTENAKADVVKFFTTDKNDEAEDKNDKDNTNNENEKDNKDSAGGDVEVTKPAPPYEESEATAYVVEQVDEFYNQK